MRFVFDTGIPLYKKWVGKERPEFGQKGDTVRFKRKEWLLVGWDSETGDESHLLCLNDFQIIIAPTSQLTFVRRFAGDHWWERLPEAGGWASDLSTVYRARIADIAAAVASLRELEVEAMERARRQWSEDEINQAKDTAHVGAKTTH